MQERKREKDNGKIFFGIIILIILILSIWLVILYFKSVNNETISSPYQLNYEECKILCKESKGSCYCSDVRGNKIESIYSCTQEGCKERFLNE